MVSIRTNNCEKTESYLLIRHLIVDHEVDPSEASEIAERASSEEE